MCLFEELSFRGYVLFNPCLKTLTTPVLVLQERRYGILGRYSNQKELNLYIVPPSRSLQTLLSDNEQQSSWEDYRQYFAGNNEVIFVLTLSVLGIAAR